MSPGLGPGHLAAQLWKYTSPCLPPALAARPLAGGLGVRRPAVDRVLERHGAHRPLGVHLHRLRVAERRVNVSTLKSGTAMLGASPGSRDHPPTPRRRARTEAASRTRPGSRPRRPGTRSRSPCSPPSSSGVQASVPKCDAPRRWSRRWWCRARPPRPGPCPGSPASGLVTRERLVDGVVRRGRLHLPAVRVEQQRAERVVVHLELEVAELEQAVHGLRLGLRGRERAAVGLREEAGGRPLVVVVPAVREVAVGVDAVALLDTRPARSARACSCARAARRENVKS